MQGSPSQNRGIPVAQVANLGIILDDSSSLTLYSMYEELRLALSSKYIQNMSTVSRPSGYIGDPFLKRKVT